MADSVVSVENLSKVYRAYSNPWKRIWEALIRRPLHREFRAIEDLTFDLGRGEGLAVIGENGAGKSTLLKILAGITAPSAGDATVRGKIASILELGSGFHPEFTGRQNIVLNAAMLGLSDRQVRAKTPEIIAFSELGDYIDQPVKFYSTGMSMRLGFAIATQVDPEVLIIDEALSVGDGYFQKKCIDRLIGFTEAGGTLLFCSHAMYYVSAFCRRALWLRDGKIEALGPTDEVVRRYESFLVAKGRTADEDSGSSEHGSEGAGPARIVSLRQLGTPSLPGRYRHLDRWGLEIEWESERPETAFHLAVGIDRLDGVQVCAMSSKHDSRPPFAGGSRRRARLWLPELPILRGSYSIHVMLLDEAALHVYDQKRLSAALEIEGEGYAVGLIEAEHEWELADPEASAGEADPPRSAEASGR